MPTAGESKPRDGSSKTASLDVEPDTSGPGGLQLGETDPSALDTQVAGSPEGSSDAREPLGHERSNRSTPARATPAPGRRDLTAKVLNAAASAEAAGSPPPDGVDRNLALARVQERLLGLTTTPVKIGRFVVIEKLGQGAMGIVYLAYDPKLDRKVALKLVDTTALGSEVGDAHIRLEREAKSAAALGHPNVVTVYDVGTHQADVFLAMEYVEGGSLTEWMDGDHSWQETVTVFAQIARGLSAAHDAGLIHRDFKPDNVLVGVDGRPRVADFGLARPTEGWSARDATRMRAQGRGSAQHSDAMASTGEVCGTPAYMAPEQFAGVEVTPASDQFGFCASLFQALFGIRPFHGESVTELAIAVIENDRAPLPPAHRVPTAVVQVVLQGLQPEPHDRHPSMKALAERLEATLRRRTRNLMLGGAALVALAGLGVGVRTSAALRETPCEAAHTALDDTWNDATRERVTAGLTAAGLSTDVLDELDAFATRWTSTRVQACQATRVSGEQSEAVLQLRMACLDRARSRLAATHGALSTAPTADMLAATPAALARIEECDDAPTLARLQDALQSTEDDTPEQTLAWQRAAGLRAQLELRRAEGPAAWRDLAQALTELGETHGIPQAIAEGHSFLGRADVARGDHAAARRHFDAALAGAVRGMDDFVAVVMIQQAEAALLDGELAVAASTARHAIAFADRAEDSSRRARLDADARMMLAAVQNRQGEAAAARTQLEALLARDDLREVPDADRLLTRGHALLGEACSRLHDLPCAIEQHETSLKLAESTPSTEPLELAGRHANVGLMRVELGDAAASVAHFHRAREIVEQAFGLRHPLRARILCDLGGIEGLHLDAEAGRAHLLEGLALHEALADSAAPQVEPLIDLSRIEMRLEDPAAAERYATRAVRAADASHPPEHPRRADPRLQLARIQRSQGRFRASATLLRQGLQSLVDPKVPPMRVAEFQFELAQSLAPINRRDAETMARMALEALPDEPGAASLRAAIERWQADVRDSGAARSRSPSPSPSLSPPVSD